MQRYITFNGGYKSALVLCLVCGCFSVSPIKVSAENDPNTLTSNNDYTAEVVKKEKAEDSCTLEIFTLEIRDKKTNEVARLKIGGIGERIRSVERLYLLENNKLIVHGKLKRADIIYVIETKTSKVVDVFWCYNPVLSPSKRFCIYEKFYPYHGLKGSQTTVMLLYDMQKSPSENILPVNYVRWPLIEVGLPVYPRPYVENKAYVLPDQQQENPFWYLRSSPFLWSEDANDIVFLCHHEGRTNIVRVNLSEGVEKPRIYEALINVADFIKPDLPKELREKEAAQLKRLSAEDIAWDGEDHVVVTPSKAYYTLQGRIRLAVP